MKAKVNSFSTTPNRQYLFTILNILLILIWASGWLNSVIAAPRLLTYSEIIRLYRNPALSPVLSAKLDALLTTPFVENRISNRNRPPLSSPALGRFLRIAFWNIERGTELPLIKLALTNPQGFAARLNIKKYPLGSDERRKIIEQSEMLSQADVIVLNEADWGVKRSGYHNVTAEIARAANMNYAFGVEFVEVDPITTGTEKFAGMDLPDRRELLNVIRVDSRRYRGLHGTAILSRYKLENVRLIPLKYQGHDWYADELNEISPLEAGKRKVGNAILEEKVRREVRRGGRMMLLAEISDQRIPGGAATIVATHLEARTEPKARRKQLQELLENIKNIGNPVILAGDMNTSGKDLSPTSLKRELTKRLGNPNALGRFALKSLTGIWLLDTISTNIIKSTLVGIDPTVRSIPIIAPNPSEDFFDELKDFRFADGNAFDFRGDRERSHENNSDTFANSNERADKGFVATNRVDTVAKISVGSKIDWFFIKPAVLTKPNGGKQSYRFAPHFGRTLTAVNDAVDERISDHYPITVDLPFAEPLIPDAEKNKK